MNSSREALMEEAKLADDGLWVKHTQYHWQRTVNGKLLDYWPSKSKFMYCGKVRVGNVQDFMRELEK